jgi:hypothetical protein
MRLHASCQAQIRNLAARSHGDRDNRVRKPSRNLRRALPYNEGMPAPQAQMMQQLARSKFASFGLKVPPNWQDPSGKKADHYRDAHKAEDRTSTPVMGLALFQPATMHKAHTNAQKMLQDKIGTYIDGICSAICSAWSQWQSAATMAGIVVAGPMVTAGQLIGPPLMPLIMASAPKSSPMELKYSTAIATSISNGWLAYTATVKLAGHPFYPAYSAVPTPVAPPMPNVPVPIGQLIQVPTTIGKDALKLQKVGVLGDPKAPFHEELFESISHAFEECYNTWKLSTMVTNVYAVATGGTPVSPIPAVGTAIMSPGGLV